MQRIEREESFLPSCSSRGPAGQAACPCDIETKRRKGLNVKALKSCSRPVIPIQASYHAARSCLVAAARLFWTVRMGLGKIDGRAAARVGTLLRPGGKEQAWPSLGRRPSARVKHARCQRRGARGQSPTWNRLRCDKIADMIVTAVVFAARHAQGMLHAMPALAPIGLAHIARP